MDDETFGTELLGRLEKIQSLLSYLCAAAKAAEERAQAAHAKQRISSEPPPNQEREIAGRSMLEEEMKDDYHQAVQKWNSGRS